MPTLEEVKAQRDAVNAAMDAWEVAYVQAGQDATAAASAGALATTAQQAAAASAQLADQKQAEARTEAQTLADMIGQPVRKKK